MTDANAPAEGPRARAAAAMAWILVAALLGLQAVLFHAHAVREVVRAYPASHDQAEYLDSCYESFESLKRQGPGDWLLGASASPTGALLQVEAPLTFEVLGPSRMTALWLAFAHFALLQIVLTWVVAWRTKSWALAYVALGLLVGSGTVFHEPGGIFDLRLDFMAMCLFGLFACIVVRGGVFAARGWSLAAGAAAACTIAMRFLVMPYLLCIFVVLLLCSNRSRRRNLAAAGLVCAAVAGPVLWAHRWALALYYLGGHLGPERFARARHAGAVTLWERLAFYPRSIAVDHAGALFLVLTALIVIAAAMMRRRGDEEQPRAKSLRRRPELLFLGLCMAVPLTILTLDVDKTQVVGGIVLVPLILLVTLWAGGAAERGRRLHLLAGLVLVTATTAFAWRSLEHERRGRHRDDARRLLPLYDRVFELSRRRKWTRPCIAGDSHADCLFAGVFNVMGYERHGELLGAKEVLANSLLPRTPDEIFAAIDAADFVLLTEPKSRRGEPYPFDRQMRKLHPVLVGVCDKRLRHELTVETSDRRIVLYSR